MKDQRFIDELSEQLARVLPGVEAAGEDIRNALSGGLQQGFRRMDLLTREEFEQQSEALARAEARIAELERTVSALEARVNSAAED